MSDVPVPTPDLPPEPTTATRPSYRELSAVNLEQDKTIVTIVKEWAGVTIAVMLTLGGFAGFVLNSAHAQTVDATKSLVEAHQALEKRFDEHVRDSGQVERDLKEDVHQLRGELEKTRQQNADDIRSLYQAIRTGKPQPALEAPVDAGEH